MIPAVIARGALAVYLVLLFIAQALLLAAPGRRVPIYAVLGLIASVPVLSDSRKVRLWAVPAIVVAMALIIYDYNAGIRFQHQITTIQLRHS